MTIIGAGYVGSTILYALMLCDVANEIVLVNRNTDKAASEIDDIRHGFIFVGDTNIRVGGFCDIKDSDVVIVAIGRNRKPGETRLDLAKDNKGIVQNMLLDLKMYYRDSIIIVVTNPIDVITKIISDEMNLPYGKIFGTGCILDSSRLIRVLADYLQCGIDRIRAMVIGEHGDGQVVLWSNILVDKIPISEYCLKNSILWNDDVMFKIETKVKNMGASIILNKGHTQFGVATCAADLANAIINDKRILASVSSPMQGEFGIKNVCLSYPSIIGRRGIVERKSIALSKGEIVGMQNAAKNLAKF